MESRERVARAIEMTGPDRVPITHATLAGAEARYGDRLNDIYARFPSDVLGVGAATSGECGPQIGVPSRDTWGSEWVRYTDEHKGQVTYCPLADRDSLSSFTPPNTSSDQIIAAVEAALARNDGALYTSADGDIIWQRMFYLHGYQRTLEDLALHLDWCAEFRDMIVAVMVPRVERLCQLDALDAIAFRDDWGTQLSLMVSPELWRSFFKPSYARLFALARDAGKHVWFHSDGVIDSIIPDLIEIGVQVLNPQVDCMALGRLVELCSGHICIQGDVDRQQTLPYGTPEEVREAVRRDIDSFGRHDGGYIGRGELAGDVPIENAIALLEEIVAYGRYSLAPGRGDSSRLSATDAKPPSGAAASTRP